MMEKIPEREDPTQKIPPNSIEHLYGPEEVTYAEDELVLLCLLRDGRPYLKSFMEHYLSMGVKHLFFMDNGSTDGTVEALREYDNVTVLRTGLPFKNYETSIRQYLVERFCQKGRWCLYADIDELFDYPYSDVVSLSSLLRYLNERSYTAVVAQMLDMFPEEPLSGRVSSPDEPLKQRHRFYDISNVKKMSIKEHPLTSINNTNNTYESNDIEFFYGGPLETLFDCIPPWLTRFTPTFSDDRLKSFTFDAHHILNARVADLTCVLLHYKFLDEHFHKKVMSAVREENYPRNSYQYKKYLEVLENTPSLQVKGESARELKSVNDLVDNHFLVVSEEYMMLVYDQQRKKGTKRAAQRTEPGGGLAEEEAAFDRTRAKAKVQTLRARRLEQRLEQLTDQHQRELENRLEELTEQLRELHQSDLENRLNDLRENLIEHSRKAKKRAVKRAVEQQREQNKMQIDKLSHRLAKTKKKAKKENRNLARQLQSMRTSRSWRLLNKLARLRARVLGQRGQG